MESETLAAAVRSKADALQAELLAKVDANLSGAILHERSGTLKASIVASLDGGNDGIVATIASVGVPYAAIQEYGGETTPHEIVPVKAQALAFAGAAGLVFARRVRHPGSRIPPHAYLGRALEDLHADILGGLKTSVRAALGAG